MDTPSALHAPRGEDMQVEPAGSGPERLPDRRRQLRGLALAAVVVVACLAAFLWALRA